MIRTLIINLLLLLSLTTLGQAPFPQLDLNDTWSPALTLMPSTPLSFSSSIIQNEVTFVDTEEAKGVLRFTQTGGEVEVETGGDTYLSTIENLDFSYTNGNRFISGENLSFSSDTSDNRADIDRLSFSGNSSDFQFELQEFHFIGSNTNWGGERLAFNRSTTGNILTGENLYIERSDGSFVEIGEGSYSSADKTLQLTSVLGEGEGYSFSADQISLLQDGESDLGQATNVYIADEAGQFISIGSANIELSPSGNSLALSELAGNADGYSFSAATLDIVDDGNSQLGNATDIFVQNENGDFVTIGEGSYSSANKSLQLTNVLGQTQGTSFSADQINLLQNGESDLGQATNIYIADEAGQFISVGTADIEVSPNGSALSLTALAGNADGYTFSAATVDVTDDGTTKLAEATNIFIQNENGDFVTIGEADYSSATGQLNLTSLIGEQGSYNFSADQLSLMSVGNESIANATNLFIANEDGEYISVGTANLEVGPDRSSLLVNGLSSTISGFNLSADQLSAETLGDELRIEVENGRAASIENSEVLTFGNAVVNSDSNTTSADIRNLSFANRDLSYASDRLQFSTNGDSFDLNTRGALTTNGQNLNLAFEATGVNSLSFGGPADDGGILIERNGDGRVTRAEGVVSLGTTDDGGFSEIGVALGDSISFSATDADGNARELTAAFRYDEAAGKFYLRTIFKGGDQTEIKVMPFTFTSEKVGEDAVAALSASIEGQDIEAYLNTMSNIIDLDRINDFIAIGRDRMQVRVGRQRGLEFYYANNSLSILDDGANSSSGGKDLALGLGFFNRGADNSVRSGGILLSSDSSLRYEVEAGKLSFNGIDLPDQGEIPLTIGAYYRHEDDEGNAVFGTLGTSLADLGTLSAGVTVERRINDHSSYNVGVAANSLGDVAASIGFKVRLGRVNNTNRRLSESSYNPSDVSDIYNSVRDFRSFGQ